MGTVFDSYEWTCEGCGVKYRVEVERVEANNLLRPMFMDVKCACGSDSARRAEFVDTKALRVTSRPEGSKVMAILG